MYGVSHIYDHRKPTGVNDGDEQRQDPVSGEAEKEAAELDTTDAYQ